MTDDGPRAQRGGAGPGAPDWPADEAFVDAARLPQVTDGRAHCTRLALCDAAGRSCRRFELGAEAHFYLEFEGDEDFGVPSAGVELRTPSGEVVHGRNSFQSNGELPRAVRAGSRLRFHQSLRLDIGPGDYVFSVGLACAGADAYEAYANGTTGHAGFQPQDLCRVPDADVLGVRFDARRKLPFFGLAALAGSNGALNGSIRFLFRLGRSSLRGFSSTHS